MDRNHNLWRSVVRDKEESVTKVQEALALIEKIGPCIGHECQFIPSAKPQESILSVECFCETRPRMMAALAALYKAVKEENR